MSFPPWQPPDYLQSLEWYLVWILSAVCSLIGFYLLHPLRSCIAAGARFMRQHTHIWIPIALIGVASRALEFSSFHGDAYGGGDTLPSNSGLPSAIVEAIGTVSKIFYYPVNSWPISILMAILLLLGWRRSYLKIWNPAPTFVAKIHSVFLGFLLLLIAALHLVHQSELMFGWLPLSEELRTSARVGGHIFQLEAALCLQAYLFVVLAQYLDTRPEALLVDRVEWTLSRAPRLLPLAAGLYLTEQLAGFLYDPEPGIVTTMKGLIVPELLILLAPLSYLLTFYRKPAATLKVAFLALAVVLPIWPRFFWLLVFALTATTLLHIISANIAISAHGLASEIWQCAEPVFEIALGVWLLASWFIMLQKEDLAVLDLNLDDPISR